MHKFNPGKHSIFVLGEEEEGEAAYCQVDDKQESADSSTTPLHAENKKANVKLERSFSICGGNAGPL